jgi:hypothetical protein
MRRVGYRASLLAFPIKKALQTTHQLKDRRRTIVRNMRRSKLHPHHLPAKIWRGREKARRKII